MVASGQPRSTSKPRWRRPRSIVAGALACGLLLFYLRATLWHPQELVGASPDDGFTRVSGVIHIHTTHSDGGGPPAEVIAAAQKVGLQFIIITDHNTLVAKPLEGYHDKLLVLVGAEISTQSGHVLGLGIADPVFRFSGDADDALDDVRLLGGTPVVAHPLRAGGEDAPTWSGWDLPGPWGLELINGKSAWLSAPWWRHLRMLLTYPANHHLALLTMLTRPDDTLARWDELLAKRDVVGSLGADAHSRVPITKRSSMRFPPYDVLLDLARTHVVLARPLSGDARGDGAAVLDALAHGRTYLGIDALAPADGFSFTASSGTQRWTMGDTAPPGVRLECSGRMPRGTRLDLRKDGKILLQGEGRIDLASAASGVYRVEAYVPGWAMPWIVSNPIYVMEPERARQRSEAAAWASEPAPPPARQTIDAFEGQSSFAAEFDSSSSMDADIVDPHGGVRGGAARVRFRLGAPAPGRPFTWCALVNRQRRDLRGFAGLTFSIRADSVYRLWVQVRDENPASKDDGIEWWFRSVRTSTQWRRVALPFARLRSINPRSDGRLDLDRVVGLVFVIDAGAEKPGTAGTIWIDDVALY